MKLLTILIALAILTLAAYNIHRHSWLAGYQAGIAQAWIPTSLDIPHKQPNQLLELLYQG